MTQQPLGVAALSLPRQQMSMTGMPRIAKSTSLPNLNRTASGGFGGPRGFDAPGAMSPLSPTSRGQMPPGSPSSPKLPSTMRRSGSQSAVALMSATFSPDGGSPVAFTGRHVAMGFWGVGPPKTGVFKKVVPRKSYSKQHVFEPMDGPVSQFRRFFERGDLPIGMRHGAVVGVEWKVEPDRLDYMHHLPMFFEGLLERTDPFASMAYSGLQDLLNAARGKQPSLLAPVVGAVIVPLKRCLNTRDNTIMCRAIQMLLLMIQCDRQVGELLVPYYRQILPTFSLFKGFHKNLGDAIDYGQRKRENMGELVAETLELMEKTGGEDAFINIKYMIPTYESCMID